MNIREYIESGVLESYVLGHANAEETAEVEGLALEYPEIDEEIKAIRNSLEIYASQFACEPPTELKTRVLHVLEDLSTDTSEEVASESKIIMFSPPVKPKFQYAAVWVLLAMSLLINVVLFYQWQESSQKVVALESEKQLLAANQASLQASYEDHLALLEHPSTERVILQGQAIAPQAKAVIYWNTQTKEVILSTLKLPTPTGSQQYQLWAIVDGKPVDAGLIEKAELPSKMKSFDNAVAFAISLEPKGGSTTASGPQGQIYVLGYVKHI